MFSGRMLSVIQYLQIHHKSSYKEAARDLQLTERNIRYDIDRINDALELAGEPCIEKQSKGVLIYPDNLVLDEMMDSSDFIYTGEERISLLLLTLLLRNEDLKINRLSRELRVSRSTIKNDMSALEKRLAKDGLSIGYTDHFFLEGPKSKRVTLLNQEFRKYISFLVNPSTNFNSFEFTCVHIIHSAFEQISIAQVIMAVNRFLESIHCPLTDESYTWYLSNIMVVIWFVLHDKEYPLEIDSVTEFDLDKFQDFRQEIAHIIHREIPDKSLIIIDRLLDFTNKYSRYANDVDLVEAESVTFSLIAAMSKQMHIAFDSDSLLVNGLLNHIIPMIQRIRNHITIGDNVMSVLGDDEKEFYRRFKEVSSEVELIQDIDNEDELGYLAIYFLASLKRITTVPYKRVLLVCGHGYGTTTMLKETLLSEYQLHIIDTIPLYKIQTYPNWSSVDCVISTTALHNDLPKPYILVNPILRQSDYEAIERLGISRKRILSNIYSIERNLHFLDEENRKKVMDVIKKELGYQTVAPRFNAKHFSSFLKYDCIAQIHEPLDWRTAVRRSGELLLKRNFIDQRYIDNVIATMETLGFYAVADDSFALLHGKSQEGVNKTSISMLVLDEPVVFGDKEVRIIFCLASKDAKEHIPAVVTLMRMVKTTPFIKEVLSYTEKEDIYQCILTYEFETA